MYVVAGVWDADPALAEVQRAVLMSRIVPGVRSAPGLVKGYWAGNPEERRRYTFIVFDSHDHAEAFAASVRANEAGQAQAGLACVEVTVAQIEAET